MKLNFEQIWHQVIVLLEGKVINTWDDQIHIRLYGVD